MGRTARRDGGRTEGGRGPDGAGRLDGAARRAPGPATEARGAVRPLVATDDADLLDDLLRLAAAAGVEVEVAAHVEAARASWASAPLVLLGADLAERLASGAPPRRRDVAVVARADTAELWRDAVAIGADHVALLPEGERWVVDRLADLQEGPSRDGVVLAVVGGRGGAGASTLCVGLALAAVRRGVRTLLVDADPSGGGLDLLLGGEDVPGMRWPDLAATRGRVAGTALEHALPSAHELAVLSWDRGDVMAVPREAMASVVDAGARGFDLTLVDLPRGVDEAAREAATRATCALLVVPAEVRATAAAARVLRSLRATTADVRLVVREPPGCTLDADVVADALSLPLLGLVAEEGGLSAAVDRGDPPGLRGRGAFSRSVEVLLDSLDLTAGLAA